MKILGAFIFTIFIKELISNVKRKLVVIKENKEDIYTYKLFRAYQMVGICRMSGTISSKRSGIINMLKLVRAYRFER